MRVFGDDSNSESHGHTHTHSHALNETAVATTTGVSKLSQNGLSSRKSTPGNVVTDNPPPSTDKGPSKMSAYLNLFGDFVHNM